MLRGEELLITGKLNGKIVHLTEKQAKYVAKKLYLIKKNIETWTKEYSTFVTMVIHSQKCTLDCCENHEIVSGRCEHCGFDIEKINEHDEQWRKLHDFIMIKEPCLLLNVFLEDMDKIIDKLPPLTESETEELENNHEIH